MPEQIIQAMFGSPEPSLRWKVRVQVLGEPTDGAGVTALREEIRSSARVQRLLAGRDPNGRLYPERGVYAKWQGAHWVLAALADIGYPSGDAQLYPLRDQVLDTWLSPKFYQEFVSDTRAGVYRRSGVPVMRGRHRRCASQQGNALWYLTRLGLINDRVGDLAERLLYWQWPDGGWNCDKDPAASKSSFCETLLPMRGLAAYAAVTGDSAAAAGARRAAEVFLTRRLVFRASTGELIRPDFACLHYPLYWHYDVLGGLKGMAELGLLVDGRCADALFLLESMRLPDGWPARGRYYRVSDQVARGVDHVNWGGSSNRRANPWVTADALAVLHEAGRL